ncbi:pyridine nucleotide-disulfide oxidoreductase [Halolactibacillus miurensis]|uniref:NADPH-dependent 2,4-dienoyl-CoA reductase, sulfur reductase n=1 Tax=Halolactibacillus miurensis TaxID=306541 RepID=A0A1I6UG24_9BACI|nr:FAD-dependent oxidoreductase [Halolactibacillus miurensis]GEM05239.1 pyridine nucleotide-disulfide oxidoreductase [Halolactibacillus miurensis]SFT00426.1 NADPH-dependent 2,4-dienoyl-CoA reductase, sulfur reductase [Halolactibacillus miurensis]
MGKKVLVVGGVAGGASVAARVRRLDEAAEIIMFERGPYVSFSNCCIPFHISGDIEKSQDLVLMTPPEFDKQYNIDARVYNEVVAINKEEKTVEVKNVQTNETYTESYDVLFLAPGAVALRPQSIEGINDEHVFVMKTVPDVEALTTYAKDNDVKDVTVVGGGYIGLEVAENLKYAGYNVTLVEAQDQVMAPLDYDMVQMINREIMKNGVDLVLGDSVQKIAKDKVILASGREINAQAVVMAIGVRPENTLAKQADLALSASGAIKVNHHYQTSDPNIYAVGDAIETTCFFTGQKTQLTLAGPAQRQARAAADHVYGRTYVNTGVIGSSSVKMFGMNAANTGLNEKQCQARGIDYDYSYVIPKDKVGLMPDSENLFFKLIFQVPSGKILGAQAVGRGNVDKRIDVIATAIMLNGNLEHLKELELTYSPHFSTAKDVVNHAALAALNILNGEVKKVPVTKVRELVESEAVIIDAREEDEYALSHIKGAVNIPLSQFRNRLDEIPKDQPVYVHCRSSQRSYNMVRALGQLGFDHVYNLDGSFLGVSEYEYFNDVVLNREPIVTDYNFN